MSRWGCRYSLSENEKHFDVVNGFLSCLLRAKLFSSHQHFLVIAQSPFRWAVLTFKPQVLLEAEDNLLK